MTPLIIVISSFLALILTIQIVFLLSKRYKMKACATGIDLKCDTSCYCTNTNSTSIDSSIILINKDIKNRDTDVYTLTSTADTTTPTTVKIAFIYTDTIKNDTQQIKFNDDLTDTYYVPKNKNVTHGASDKYIIDDAGNLLYTTQQPSDGDYFTVNIVVLFFIKSSYIHYDEKYHDNIKPSWKTVIDKLGESDTQFGILSSSNYTSKIEKHKDSDNLTHHPLNSHKTEYNIARETIIIASEIIDQIETMNDADSKTNPEIDDQWRVCIEPSIVHFNPDCQGKMSGFYLKNSDSTYDRIPSILQTLNSTEPGTNYNTNSAAGNDADATNIAKDIIYCSNKLASHTTQNFIKGSQGHAETVAGNGYVMEKNAPISKERKGVTLGKVSGVDVNLELPFAADKGHNPDAQKKSLLCTDQSYHFGDNSESITTLTGTGNGSIRRITDGTVIRYLINGVVYTRSPFLIKDQ